jgi:hypothetical protein
MCTYCTYDNSVYRNRKLQCFCKFGPGQIDVTSYKRTEFYAQTLMMPCG